MLIAGNWKMNTDLAEAVRLASEVARATDAPEGVAVVICPPFISLEAAAEITRDTAVRLGAQNLHEEESGAFTGEVSAPMLASVGCDYVILGHSERRELFGETDERINRKVHAAVRHGLVPILCVGETLDQREAGDEESVVGRQLDAALDGIDLDEMFNDALELVVAYEPVWAIGTGKTASPEQAQAMHRFIRDRLAERFGENGKAVSILYGGSMKPANAAELLAQPDIDGGLIGGASLDAESFGAIVKAAQEQMAA